MGKVTSVPTAIKYEHSQYDKAWILKTLATDASIMDARCWKKPIKQLTRKDLVEWIQGGAIPCNSGHGVFCIRRALEQKFLTVSEMADALFKNTGEGYQHFKVGEAFEYNDEDFGYDFWFDHSNAEAIRALCGTADKQSVIDYLVMGV